MSLNSDGTALMGRGLLAPSFVGEEDDGGGGLALPGTTVMTVGLALLFVESSASFPVLDATTMGIRRVVEAVEAVEVALVDTESWNITVIKVLYLGICKAKKSIDAMTIDAKNKSFLDATIFN